MPVPKILRPCWFRTLTQFHWQQGLFHEWAAAQAQPVAIVETRDGKIVLPHAFDVQFCEAMPSE